MSDQEILEIESYHASTGKFPSSDPRSLSHQILQARLLDQNARKAEALALAGLSDPLQVIRNQLMRGNIQSTKPRLSDLEQSQNPEVVLEKARVAAFEKDWDRYCRSAYENGF